MNAEFWKARWDEGRIAFHEKETNAHLARHHQRLASAPTRVLVPLCGKSLDLAFLAAQGHEVVGVEIVERAARDFFAERSIEPSIGTSHGLRSFSGNGITIVTADFFEVDEARFGRFAAIYDRAALIALPPEVRVRYAKHVTALSSEEARMLLVTIEYDQARMPGPPFSVPFDEVRAHYAERFTLEELTVDANALASSPHLAARGLDALTERATLLTSSGRGPHHRTG